MDRIMRDLMDVHGVDGMLEEAVRLILSHVDDNYEREGLAGTPARVVRSWKRLYGGYGVNAADVLGTTFHNDGVDQVVVLRDIEFYSMCEHHMLPFLGRVHIAYIPRSRVVGISKLARLVEVYARRLQIQERMTQQIADAITQHLDPVGVAVMVKAQHLCMVSRGVEKQNSEMVTSVLAGAFREDDKARAEAMRLFR